MSLESVLQWLLYWFQLYGYYVVFVALLAENTVVLGLIIPGETVLLAASFLAAQGELSLPAVMAVGWSGAVCGNNIGYLIGRHGGRPFLERYGRYFLISPERLAAAERYFDSHGPRTVFVGRFAAGVRVFISMLAGASHMDYRKFLLYTLASVTIWTLALTLLGYFFGYNWPLLQRILKQLGWGALILLTAAVALAVWRKRRRVRAQGSGDDDVR